MSPEWATEALSEHGFDISYLIELSANEGTFREWANLYFYYGIEQSENPGINPSNPWIYLKEQNKTRTDILKPG